jgi:hypothetical protein
VVWITISPRVNDRPVVEYEWGHLGVSRVMWGCAVFFGFFGVVMLGVKSSQDGRSRLQNGFDCSSVRLSRAHAAPAGGA